MLVDTHCHLYFPPLIDEINLVIDEAREAGVEKMVVPGINEETSHLARELAESFEDVYFAVGLHPNELKSDISPDEQISFISKFHPHQKLVAIGEIGLDFRFRRNAKDLDSLKRAEMLQMRAFNEQVEIACELGLPIIIHNKDAGKEIISLLERHSKASGVFHCYDGAKRTLNFLKSSNFYVSFAGNITYKKNAHLLKALRNVPIERILIETDAPFMSPEPFHGLPCKPCYLRETFAFISETLAKFSETTKIIVSQNAYKLFGWRAHNPFE